MLEPFMGRLGQRTYLTDIKRLKPPFWPHRNVRVTCENSWHFVPLHEQILLLAARTGLGCVWL